MDRCRDSGFVIRDSTLIFAVLVAFAGCNRAEQPDAYGNVEADEVVVSSEVGGQLTTFTVDEGQLVTAGQSAGTVDPTQLTLQRRQAVAQRDAADGAHAHPQRYGGAGIVGVHVRAHELVVVHPVQMIARENEVVVRVVAGEVTQEPFQHVRGARE